MKTSVKILIPLVVIAVFAACSDLFNRGNNGPQLNVQTTKSPTQTTTFNGDTLVFTPYVPTDSLPPRDYPPFTSQLNDRQIEINGYFLAPNSNYTPATSLSKSDSTITIHVKKPENLKSVTYLAQGWFYDAYISNLAKGRYTVKIVHKHDMMRGIEGEEHTVFSKEFEIK